MTLLDDATTSTRADERADAARTIDLTDETTRTSVDAPRPDLHDEDAHAGAGPPGLGQTVSDLRVDLSGRMPRRGMRIRRLRLGSVATIAAVFVALGFVVVVGTLVVVWNVAQSLGFVTDLEELIVTSLGFETFEIDGGGLLRLVVLGAAALAAIGWLLTVLLAAVYNATAALLGGLALETGPLQRRRLVYSRRHRRFVTVRV